MEILSYSSQLFHLLRRDSPRGFARCGAAASWFRLHFLLFLYYQLFNQELIFPKDFLNKYPQKQFSSIIPFKTEFRSTCSYCLLKLVHAIYARPSGDIQKTSTITEEQQYITLWELNLVGGPTHNTYRFHRTLVDTSTVIHSYLLRQYASYNTQL